MNFSIIIPHKNSVELLARLLESIPIRNDLEIIIVDDNSMESEKQKLDDLRNNFSFTLLNNKGNKGAGSSRNVGLSEAKGKWIVFADSDDYFVNDFNKILDSSLNYPEDVIFFKVDSVNSLSYVKSHRHVFFNSLIDDYIRLGKEDILYKYSVPWGKMYKLDFIKANKLAFTEVLAGNDMYFSCSVGLLATSYKVVDQILYVVTAREGSIVNTINSIFFRSRFDETIRVNNLLRSKKLGMYQYSILYFLANAFKIDILTGFYVIKELIRNRSNLMIGLEKVFNYKAVLSDRENRVKKK